MVSLAKVIETELLEESDEIAALENTDETPNKNQAEEASKTSEERDTITPEESNLEQISFPIKPNESTSSENKPEDEQD